MGNSYSYVHTYQHIAQEARDEGNVYVCAMRMAIAICMNKCTSRELNHAKFFFLSHIIYIRLYIHECLQKHVNPSPVNFILHAHS